MGVDKSEKSGSLGKGLESRINDLLNDFFGEKVGSIRLRCAIQLPVGEEKTAKPAKGEVEVLNIVQEGIQGDVDRTEPDTKTLYQRKAAINNKSEDYSKAKWIFYASDAADSLISRIVLRMLGELVYEKIAHYYDSIQAYESLNSSSASEISVDNQGWANLSDREWLKRNLVEKLLHSFNLPERALVNQMSSLKYEKRELHTSMCIENRDTSESMSIKLDKDSVSKYSLHSNLTVARKLLELAGDSGTLVLKKVGKDFSMLGVSQSKGAAKCARVEFEGYMKWTLLNGDEPLCKYREGEYEFIGIVRGSNAVPMAFKEVEAELKKILKGLPECKIKDKTIDTEQVESVLKKIYKNSSHGTAIVFLDKKTRKSELDRLSGVSRAYKIDPISLNDEKVDLKGVASIDGAIIAGFDMKCYAVGAILDGKAVITGDAGRGARYNSVLNYACWICEEYEKTKPSIMVMIRSEDGMVTLKTTEDLRRALES